MTTTTDAGAPGRPAPHPAQTGVRGAGARSAPGALGNNVTPTPAAGDDAARERRNEAWKLRRKLWEISTIPRVRACGRVSRVEGGPVLRVSGDAGARRAGFAGLVHCASPWACPCCARRIGAQRAQEIREVVSAVYAEGGSAALVTLTLQHHAGHALADSWGALRHAWSRVTAARAYSRERDQFGIGGWIAAAEITHGDAGFHPHLHIVVVFDTPMSDLMVEELAGRWFARYERALGKRGFSALEFRGGLDARTVTADSSGALGVYLSKLALEVTSTTTKTARRSSSRTMWQVLNDGLSTGLASDLDAWWEYERASHGRKMLTFSRGLRRRYRLAEEKTDEEIASEDAGGDDVIALPVETWRAIRDQAEELLTAAEHDGMVGAALWLTERRLEWASVRSGPY